MDDKEKIKQLEKQLADANDATKKAEEARDAALKDVAERDETIKSKDQIIEQKNQDLVGARKKYSEMSEEDKAKLTEQERELARRQEELDQKMADFEKSQADAAAAQRDYHRDAAIKRLVGDDPEAAKKIQFNYDRIKDAGEAQTPDQIEKAVVEAYNMLGEDKPAAVGAAAAGAGGGAPEAGKADDFSESAEGKDLMGKMFPGQEEEQKPEETPAPANPALDQIDQHIN